MNRMPGEQDPARPRPPLRASAKWSTRRASPWSCSSRASACFLAAWVASPEASFVTGAVLPVNGGMCAVSSSAPNCAGFLREAPPLGPSLVLRGRSTKSAASSASLRKRLARHARLARTAVPWLKSTTWPARAATGKSAGISPALIPSRKRRSTIAAAPAEACWRNCRTSASSTSGAMHTMRQPAAEPSSVAFSTVCLRKPAIEARSVLGEKRCLRSASALLHPVLRPEDAQEQRPLVAEDGVQARPTKAHLADEIVDRRSVVALRPKHLGRLLQRFQLVEAARPSARPGVFLDHLVQNSLRPPLHPIKVPSVSKLAR